MKLCIGISGSIAAYRSADVVKALVAKGHEVRCVLTQGGSQFVTSKVLETFSKNRVLSWNVFDDSHFSTDHIELARWADAFLVYGASANFMGRLASGLADDFLTLQLLAFQGPVLLIPAMNPSMWSNPIVQRNRKSLSEMGYQFLDPIAGRVACGEEGVGHVANDESIFEVLAGLSKKKDLKFNQQRDLEGKHILISVGPMQTAIDPVRVIQNRSSGKMGLSLALACKDRGAKKITILLGPVSSEVEKGFSAFQITHYKSPEDYGQSLHRLFPESDFFFSAAAVLDFEVLPSPTKIDRSSFSKESKLEIAIKATPDFVGKVGAQKKAHQKVIAFAAETGSESEILERATLKMKKKSADAIIANPVAPGVGPDSEENIVWVLRKQDHLPIKIGPKPKTELGHLILDALLTKA